MVRVVRRCGFGGSPQWANPYVDSSQAAGRPRRLQSARIAVTSRNDPGGIVQRHERGHQDGGRW